MTTPTQTPPMELPETEVAPEAEPELDIEALNRALAGAASESMQDPFAERIQTVQAIIHKRDTLALALMPLLVRADCEHGYPDSTTEAGVDAVTMANNLVENLVDGDLWPPSMIEARREIEEGRERMLAEVARLTEEQNAQDSGDPAALADEVPSL